jgi:hypothetical protein
MAIDNKLDSDLKIFPSNTTLGQAIKGYLETPKNHTETHVLKKLMEYAEKENRAGKDMYIKAIKPEFFKSFFIWLRDEHKVSEAILKDYRVRLRGFQEYIGLSEVKVKKNRNPENDESELERTRGELAKTQKERDKEHGESVARWKTIEDKEAENAKKDVEIARLTEERGKECSQCKKLAEKENVNILHRQRIDKLTTENKEKDRILDVEKAELESKEGEIASLKTDNEFLKKALEEQSHDKLLEQNQYLKVQLGQKDADNERKEKRIREVEQLIEIEKRQKGEFVTRVLRTVRECKEYMPSTNESFSIAEYKRNSLKSMTNLEDYINGSCQDA